jgi:hypothetical protein
MICRDSLNTDRLGHAVFTHRSARFLPAVAYNSYRPEKVPNVISASFQQESKDVRSVRVA